MKLIIVRHAEPDYSIDSLTEKGWKEAELLSERLKKIPVDAYYVSPLGRARDTAAPTLSKVGRKAEVCEWLREFNPRVLRPDDQEARHCAWDWLPQDMEQDDRLFDRENWTDCDPFQEAGVRKEYDWVISEFDKLLERHGYRRNGLFYDAVRPNDGTIMFFCHFGLECVLLSHLMNVSPMTLWHGLCAAPSSVSTIYTEERREGKALFRMQSFGDISHLYVAEEPASFAARFCELYTNKEERHD